MELFEKFVWINFSIEREVKKSWPNTRFLKTYGSYKLKWGICWIPSFSSCYKFKVDASKPKDGDKWSIGVVLWMVW